MTPFYLNLKCYSMLNTILRIKCFKNVLQSASVLPIRVRRICIIFLDPDPYPRLGWIQNPDPLQKSQLRREI